MPQKCQTILLGIGDTGQRVVRQYLAEYGDTIQLKRDTGGKVVVLSHGKPLERHVADDGAFGHSSSEQGLLDQIAAAFETLLGDRPVRDFGQTYYLDVFVCGAWRDEEFRNNLPLVLPFIERLAHERYASIFNPGEDLRNARLLVHPLALSVNMPRETSRQRICRLLVNIDRWHQDLADVGRAVIPRFFLYDGFTNNIQLNEAEVVGITAHFVGLCTRGGVRADREFRQLLNFSTYTEDFFCVLNLATIYFAREHFRRHALRLIAAEFYGMLTEKPDLRIVPGADRQVEAGGIKQLIREDILGSRLLRHAAGSDHYRSLILDKMLAYDQKIDPRTPALEEHLARIFSLRKTFPADPPNYPPETLERFFDRRWLYHLLDSCYPPPGQDVATAYETAAAELRELWNRELKRILDRLDRGLGDLLGSGEANFSLNTFSAALHRCHGDSILPARQQLTARAAKLPQRRWRFTTVRDIWARVRAQIWNFIPAHAIKYWLPFLSALSALQLLALYRFGLTFLDPNTEGAQLLQNVNRHPVLLPTLIAVSIALSLPVLGVVYLFKRRRLKRYLDTAPADTTEEYPDVVDDDAPELVGSGEFEGLLPSVGSVMARKTGVWWNKQETLGAIGLVQGVLRLIDLKVQRIRETAERVLRRIEESIAAEAGRQKPRLVSELYFSDHLLDPELADTFAGKINNSFSIKISAQNVARRLHKAGVESFLVNAADPEYVLAEAEREVPFFDDGCIFAQPVFEANLAANLRLFLAGLSDRLSHGQIFHFLASQEQDKLIEDTQILVVCPSEALGILQDIEKETQRNYKKILSCELDHIWGLRIIRDVSTQSILRYMNPDLSTQDIERLIDEWLGSLADESGEQPPWSELKVEQ